MQHQQKSPSSTSDIDMPALQSQMIDSALDGEPRCMLDEASELCDHAHITQALKIHPSESLPALKHGGIGTCSLAYSKKQKRSKLSDQETADIELRKFHNVNNEKCDFWQMARQGLLCCT